MWFCAMWESEAPAELAVHRFGRSLTLPSNELLDKVDASIFAGLASPWDDESWSCNSSFVLPGFVARIGLSIERHPSGLNGFAQFFLSPFVHGPRWSASKRF